MQDIPRLPPPVFRRPSRRLSWDFGASLQPYRRRPSSSIECPRLLPATMEAKRLGAGLRGAGANAGQGGVIIQRDAYAAVYR